MVKTWQIPTPDWDTDADWLIQIAERRGGEQVRHHGPGPHKSGTPQSVHGGTRVSGGVPKGWHPVMGVAAIQSDDRKCEVWAPAEWGPTPRAAGFPSIGMARRAVNEVAVEVDHLRAVAPDPLGRPLSVRLMRWDPTDPVDPAATTVQMGYSGLHPLPPPDPRDPVRIYLNPRLWTDPSYRDRYSRGRSTGRFVPTEAPIVQQALTHEWGHVVAGPGDRDVGVALTAVPSEDVLRTLPRYAAVSPAEAYAEAFAAWTLDRPGTSPEWVRNMATASGDWPAEGAAR